MNASELLSKTVIDINSAEVLGTAKALCFDEYLRKLQSIIAFSDDTETDILVLPKNIYSVGGSAIMVRSASPLMFEKIDQKQNNPLGSAVYNLEGEFLGKITEVELTQKYNSKKIFLGDINFDMNQILSVNLGTVVINTSGKKIIKKANPFKNAKKFYEPKIRIMPIETPPKIEVPNIPQIQPASQTQNQLKPYLIDTSPSLSRAVTAQSFLVGRKATRAIYGINNEVLVKKDGNITQKTIDNAILHSKLNELAVYSSQK